MVETVNNRLDIFKLVIACLILISAIAGFYLYADQSLLLRVIGMLVAVGIAAAISFQTAKGRQIWLFIQDAQIEVKKVVWPTRQETVQTTMIVVIMVVIVAIILWLLDLFLGWAIASLMGHGG